MVRGFLIIVMMSSIMSMSWAEDDIFRNATCELVVAEVGSGSQELSDTDIRGLWQKKINEIGNKIRTKMRAVKDKPLPSMKEDVLDIDMVEPKWRDVAGYVHELLNDPGHMAGFVEKLLQRVLEESLKVSEDRHLLPYHLNKKAAAKIYSHVAKELGWKKVYWLTSDRPDQFFDLLAAGYLFRDLGSNDLRHGSDGHLLQIFAVTAKVDARFGAKTMSRFLKFMGKTRGGREVWNRLFDLGPRYFYTFNSSAGFYDFGVIRALDTVRVDMEPGDDAW